MSDTAVKVNAPKTAASVPGAAAPKRCSCGGAAGPSGECEECGKKREMLQRASSGGSAPGAIPASVNQTIASPGRPLDAGTRSFMESRFGHDFGGVRVHTDDAAARSAGDVNARAYTVGQHVAFNRGQYQPDTPGGRHLLAHELAHTVQQRNATPSVQRLTVDPVDSQDERRADAVAQAASRGTPVAISPHSDAARLQRAPLTWQQIYALEVPDEERISGTRVHTVIGQDFKQRLGIAKKKNDSGRVGFRIPGSSFGAYRTEDCEDDAPTEIEPQEFDPKPNQGYGSPDLAYKDGTHVEMAEIKIGVIQCQDTAERQLQHYIDNAESPDNEEWRKRRGFATFGKMTDRYTPPNPITVDDRQVAVAWVDGAPGILIYKPIPAAQTLTAPADVATEPYVVKVGDNEIVFQLPPTATGAKTEQIDLHESPIPGNQQAAESLQGIILRTLTRKSRGNDTISASIETKANPKATAPSAQPLVVDGKQDVVTLVVNRQTRQLSHQSKKVNIPFSFKGLSQGTITTLNFEPDGGLSGEGRLKPSIPLLSAMNLGIAFGPNDLRVTSGVEKEKLPRLVPGMRITEAKLELMLVPEFRPSGTIAVAFGPESKPYVVGVIEVSVDTEGFLAAGKVTANIPGVDQTEGTVQYRPATGWSGQIAITTSQIPHVQNASVIVQISQEKGLIVEGSASIVLLNDQLIGVQVKRRDGRWIYTGRGTLKLPVPAVKPVDIVINYDGRNVWGEGTAGFHYRELDGTFNVKYRNGNFSGTGKVAIQKGKANGSLNVNLNDRGRIYGDGQINYQLTPNLVVVLGVELPEAGPLRVTSGVRLPKPIPLFGEKRNDFRLFAIKFPFWIPYVSIPGVGGLKVSIEGALDLGYYLGAGVVRGVSVMAAFNPLEDDPDLAIKLGGELYIPFGGNLKGSITAALELDGFVAGVSAGITAWADARLGCEFKLRTDIDYAKERFALTADASILCALTFELGLKFIVKAYLATYDDKWEWPIAGVKWDPGLSLGAKFPFRYASDRPFVPPSFDQIEWIKPNLDPERMLKSVIDAAKK